MNTRELAADQVRAIIGAMIQLGGSGTVAAISEACGLPAAVVQRRLIRSGPSMIRTESRFFTRIGMVWGLSEAGRMTGDNSAPPTLTGEEG